MGALGKRIFSDNQRGTLCLALATLSNWSFSAASICRVLRLPTSEVEDLIHLSPDTDDSYRLERSRLVLELSIVINATFENPTNRNRFITGLTPFFLVVGLR